jgi:hypothetical protein
MSAIGDYKRLLLCMPSEAAGAPHSSQNFANGDMACPFRQRLLASLSST